MQSRIKNEPAKIEEKPFPKLMEGRNGLVVFFRDQKTGIVVHPNDIWSVGDFSNDWNPNKFTDFESVIELENDK